MRSPAKFSVAMLAAAMFMTAQSALADPCGMVPPIYPGQEIPLARVGHQMTYVYFKDGVETFVIRPGFTGKVEEFGMLIPFPTPPTLRKVPDHIFEHIAAAVDPPEVVVDLRPRIEFFNRSLRRSQTASNKPLDALGVLKEDEVRVVREEAVGMYEVAVLEAGSSKALKRWMDDHGYRYPKGMDRACNDYVDLGWCFVAVKTKVGEKAGVDPKPGQRDVDTRLPKGSTFDGHVQGMGFRFRVDELVVPMRLSAFNEGELHNIVYLLTDGPRKIQSIPAEYVVRQVPGEQLYRNLTELLPVRIIGGSANDIPQARWEALKSQRNPFPRNGAARELFASDLLATKSGELALPHEEQEKELLRIGERFGLRGPEIDKLNEASLAELRSKTLEGALEALKGMTLTVIDGDFPRELLAKQNLKFVEHRMPARLNSPEFYDAKSFGPAPKQVGVLHLGALDRSHKSSVAQNGNGFGFAALWLASGLFFIAAGMVVVWRIRRPQRNFTNSR